MGFFRVCVDVSVWMCVSGCVRMCGCVDVCGCVSVCGRCGMVWSSMSQVRS